MYVCVDIRVLELLAGIRNTSHGGGRGRRWVGRGHSALVWKEDPQKWSVGAVVWVDQTGWRYRVVLQMEFSGFLSRNSLDGSRGRQGWLCGS